MVIEVPRPHKTAQGHIGLFCFATNVDIVSFLLPYEKGPISNIPSMMFIKAKGPIYVFV